jgi:hypothetical protein
VAAWSRNCLALCTSSGLIDVFLAMTHLHGSILPKCHLECNSELAFSEDQTLRIQMIGKGVTK